MEKISPSKTTVLDHSISPQVFLEDSGGVTINQKLNPLKRNDYPRLPNIFFYSKLVIAKLTRSVSACRRDRFESQPDMASLLKSFIMVPTTAKSCA